MDYVFDLEKDASNREKHGVSLALAEVLFSGPNVSVSDRRFDYGEDRRIAFGNVNGRMFACVYTDRGAERRIISLRKANVREARKFGYELQ